MAVMGHSYGGYAALAALTLTPDLFACGAASSTIANLVAFVNNFPKTPDNAWVRATIGDPENPGDAQMLRSVSPFFLVDRLSKPLLIARGDRDSALALIRTLKAQTSIPLLPEPLRPRSRRSRKHDDNLPQDLICQRVYV